MKKKIIFIYWSIFLLLFLSIIELSFVSAGEISDCGTLDTENTIYTLTNNVNSTDTCFNITANNITLDCQGYEINYSSDGGNNEHGVYSTSNSSTIKNCNIVEGVIVGNFDSAIYFNNAKNGIINNNIITTSGISSYGIYLSTNSNNNTISNNTITTSEEYAHGINLYSNTNNNLFLGINVNTNNIYANTINVDDGDNNFIIIDSILNSSLAEELFIGPFSMGGTWNFTNVTRSDGNPINAHWRTDIGTLNMMWYLDINVTNSTNVLENVNVTSYDVNNDYQFSTLTGSNGQTRQILLEYQSIDNVKTYFSNYTINTLLSEYDDDSQSINMSVNKQLNIILIPTLILYEKFSVTGQTVYNIMNSAGAGLGSFMNYLSQSIFGFLVLIAVICVFSIIGYALAQTIIESVKNSRH